MHNDKSPCELIITYKSGKTYRYDVPVHRARGMVEQALSKSYGIRFIKVVIPLNIDGPSPYDTNARLALWTPESGWIRQAISLPATKD